MTVSQESLEREQTLSRQPRNVTIAWPAVDVSPRLIDQEESEPVPPLPQPYDQTVLYLLVRNPESLYAFWNIGRDQHEQLKTLHSTDIWQRSAKVLRVFEFRDEQEKYFDLGIGDASSWYVNGISPDSDYRAELGLVTPDGSFLLLAKSNLVHSPRSTFSDLTDEEWLTLDELYSFSVGIKGMKGSEEVLQAAKVHLEKVMGSEAVSSISSPWGAWAQEVGPELELEVQTYLTLTGRTTPGALLNINNQSIVTDDHGAFVHSLPLAEGLTALAVNALLPGQEMKKTTKIDISRRTR